LKGEIVNNNLQKWLNLGLAIVGIIVAINQFRD
jgi:hypothetical protein